MSQRRTLSRRMLRRSQQELAGIGYSSLKAFMDCVLSKWKGRPVREAPHRKVRISSNPAKQIATAKSIALALGIRLSTIANSGPHEY